MILYFSALAMFIESVGLLCVMTFDVGVYEEGHFATMELAAP